MADADHSDPAALAGQGARDDHAAVETTRSSPPQRCLDCGAHRHRWQVSEFSRPTDHGLVRLYRRRCECDCGCDAYQAFVDPQADPDPFAPEEIHWVLGVQRTPEITHREPDGVPTVPLKEVPTVVLGPRSGLPLPPAPTEPAPTFARNDPQTMRAVLDGLRRLRPEGA